MLGGENLERWELMCDNFFCEGAHPNEAGYSYIAAHVYKHLFLKSSPKPTQFRLDWDSNI